MIFLSLLLILSWHRDTYASSKDVDDIDPSKTVIWGPGLNPQEVIMPARYVFLQLYHSDGKNLTRSPGKDIISVEVKGQTKQGYDCRIWTQLLDCNDGSFIIRYKLYNTCFNLRMAIKVKGQQIALKPEVFKGPIYEEECYCPNPSIENWLGSYECSDSYSQIDEDLQPFPVIDFDKIRDNIIKEYDRPNSVSICHYVIKNNRIYRQCYGQHIGFKIFADSILLSLARKVNLPDTEFFMNLGDWPLVDKRRQLFPIFSWCGSEDSMDIVLPTYGLTDSSLKMMGGVMLDMLSVQENVKVAWEKKIEKIFWRGRDSRRERLDLIDIARENPDLFNASLTNFFFFKDDIAKYGPAEPHVSFFNFFQYKYQLNIDGTVAAYRFPYLLAGDSVVFKQDSKYYEYFYRHALAGKHYVQVKRDLSDLVEKVKWARDHDEQVRKMSKAARQLTRDLTMPRDVLCYHVFLLQEWSRRIKSKIKILKDMEEVVQPDYSCSCEATVEAPVINPKNEL